jgi:ribosomal protein S18 acetylase RimI-like enzyme
MGDISVRGAFGVDAAVIASIWGSGWREVHLGHVPDALTQARTVETFVSRAQENIPRTLVAAAEGQVVGFVVIVDDEIEQLYVDAAKRSGGVADALLSAAEARIADAGFPRAWLAVVADNARARRFYERCGWIDEGSFRYAAATQDGPVDVPCRRYAKQLSSRDVSMNGKPTREATPWARS